MSTFKRKNITELSLSVKELLTAGSVFKGNVFKASLKAEQVSDRSTSDYLNSVLSFVTKWTDYGHDLDTAIHETSVPDHNVRIYCDYDSVKDYLYAKYDYASVLPFADGVCQGVSDNKFVDEDDVEDFFEHTVHTAFKNRADTTAGLLDDVNDLGGWEDAYDSKTSDLGQFKAVKSQHILEVEKDSKELYKAIEKVVQFIQLKFNSDTTLIKKNPRLFVAMVNYIVEYMSFSAVAYASRIYAIGVYANQFIEDVPVQTNESVETSDSLDQGVISTADDMFFRDVTKTEEIAEFMNEWLSKIGAQKVENFKHALDRNEETSNAFYQQTIANPLREFLSTNFNGIYPTNMRNMEKLRDRVKEYTHNTLQGLQGTNSAKQELLYVIKTLKPEGNTVEGYQKLAYDMEAFLLPMLYRIGDSYFMIQGIVMDEQTHPIARTSEVNAATAVLIDLADLFKDISLAMITRARDIEMSIANIKVDNTNKKMEELKINIPGGETSDLSNNDNTMMGVPDTTRAPLNLSSMYALPKMESLEMYDEYVKTVLGFEGDPYYEAVDISSIINALQAFFTGLRRKAQKFFNDKQFRSAVDWCKEHQQQLNGAKFQGEMEVLPYKKDTNIDIIDVMINGIKSFKDTDCANNDAKDKFVARLYNNNNDLATAITTGKSNNNNAKTGVQKYQDWILFGTPLTSDENVKPVTIKDNDIAQNLNTIWMDNVMNADETNRQLTQKLNEMDNALKTFRQRIVSMTGNQQNTNSTTNNNTNQQNNTQSTTNQNTNTQSTTAGSNNTNNQQQNDDFSMSSNNADISRTLLVETQKAMNTIWDSTYGAITRSIKEQYAYIQQAWNLRVQ